MKKLCSVIDATRLGACLLAGAAFGFAGPAVASTINWGGNLNTVITGSGTGPFGYSGGGFAEVPVDFTASITDAAGYGSIIDEATQISFPFVTVTLYFDFDFDDFDVEAGITSSETLYNGATEAAWTFPSNSWTGWARFKATLNAFTQELVSTELLGSDTVFVTSTTEVVDKTTAGNFIISFLDAEVAALDITDIEVSPDLTSFLLTATATGTVGGSIETTDVDPPWSLAFSGSAAMGGTEVPLPAALTLLASGLGLLGIGYGRRKTRGA